MKVKITELKNFIKKLKKDRKNISKEDYIKNYEQKFYENLLKNTRKK